MTTRFDGQCERIFPPGDERIPSIAGMLAGRFAHRIARRLWWCDGQAWHLGRDNGRFYFVRLGEAYEARERFPDLFAEPIPMVA